MRYFIIGFLAFGLTFGTEHSLSAGQPTGALASFAIKRTWSDSSGKFKIEGKLDFADSNIAHIKTTDGKLNRIPLGKLSSSDRSFVEEFLKAEAAAGSGAEENPFMAAEVVSEPEPATADDTFSEAEEPTKKAPKASGKSASSSNKLDNKTKSDFPRRNAFAKASKPIALSFDKSFWKATPPFGLELAEISDLNIATDIAKPFFADFELRAAGKSPLAVINVYQTKMGEIYSNFTAVSLVSGDATPTSTFDAPMRLLALSPDGKRAMAVKYGGNDKEKDSVLVLFNVDGTGLQVDFEFIAGGGDWDGLRWATFLPGNRVMTISGKNTVSIWDTSNPRGVNLVSRGNLGKDMPMFTTLGNDQIGLVNDKALAVVDSMGLKQIGCIVTDKPILAACFSHDGSKIAVQHTYELAVYSTTDGQMVKSIPTPQPDRTRIACHKDYAILGDIVYNIQKGFPVWSYEGLSHATALADLSIRAFPGDNGTNLTTLHLPHDAALIASESFSANDLYSVVPGTPVRITVDVKGSFSPQQIQEAITENVTKAGWKVSTDADIVVTASLVQGAQQKEEYVTSEGRFGIPPPMFARGASGPVEEVTFTPWTHKVEIKRGAEVLYTNVNYVGAPSSFQSKEGESTQAAVSRFVQPRVDYYRTLNLPPYLYKPELQKGLGQSRLDAAGLQSAN